MVNGSGGGRNCGVLKRCWNRASNVSPPELDEELLNDNVGQSSVVCLGMFVQPRGFVQGDTFKQQKLSIYLDMHKFRHAARADGGYSNSP